MFFTTEFIHIQNVPVENRFVTRNTVTSKPTDSITLINFRDYVHYLPHFRQPTRKERFLLQDRKSK